MDEQPKSDIPTFAISESARARLVWIAVEEQVSYADAVDILTDYYCAAKGIGRNLDEFYSILTLSRELAVREIPVREVHFALALRRYLAEHELGVSDLDLAVQLLKLLHQFGLTEDHGRIASLLELACKLDTSGVSLADVEDWLAKRKPPSRP